MQNLSRRHYNRPILGSGRGLLAGLAVLVAGCGAFGPELALPNGAVPMAPRPEYAEWFARTEHCSSLRGSPQAIQWYVVPEAETFETAEGAKVGMWEKSGGVSRIIIAGRYLGHEMVVRHEILHHLLDREGHPSEFFTDRCRLTWESWNQLVNR